MNKTYQKYVQIHGESSNIHAQFIENASSIVPKRSQIYEKSSLELHSGLRRQPGTPKRKGSERVAPFGSIWSSQRGPKTPPRAPKRSPREAQEAHKTICRDKKSIFLISACEEEVRTALGVLMVQDCRQGPRVRLWI